MISDDDLATQLANDTLLASDTPLRLATLTASGYPRITPLWFLWVGGAYHMTSLPAARHLQDLRRDRHATICIDIESPRSIGGIRPNLRMSARGLAEVTDDADGVWTARITRKYCGEDPAVEEAVERRCRVPRMLIRLMPDELVTVGTFSDGVRAVIRPAWRGGVNRTA